MLKAKIMVSQLAPRTLVTFLKSIRKNKEYSKEEVIERVEKLGEKQARLPILISELIAIFDTFQLIDFSPTKKTFILTDFGLLLKSVLLRNEALFFEVYHLMNYYAFNIYGQKVEHIPFKSYQLICDAFYNSKKKQDFKNLSYEVESTISKELNVTGAFDESCITRALTWLRNLSPPAIAEGEFKLRTPLHLESLLWNLNLVYKYKGLKYKDPLFLDSDVIESISRASMMDSAKFNEILSGLARRFPSIISLRTSISGSYLILTKEAKLEDIL